MCKYINFNNLKKKKWFVGGGVVVGWSSPLWKYKKQLRKHKNKEEKTQKIKTHPLPQTSFFVFFYFQEQKTVIKNKNQTDP